GKFDLGYLTLPSGENATDQSFVTRYARALPGMVDWLYPNVPDNEVAPGEYQLGVHASGSSEEIEVRVYMRQASSAAACQLAVDVLVSDALIDENLVDRAGVDESVNALMSRVVALLAPANVQINYVATVVTMPSADLVLGDAKRWPDTVRAVT